MVALAACIGFAGCGDPGKSATSPSGEQVKRVGLVQVATTTSLDLLRDNYVRGLASEGFVEGDNLYIKLGNAQGDIGTLNLIVNDYISGGYDLIGTVSTQALQAAAKAAPKIPVVFCGVIDPVAAGAATSLERGKPGITGVSNPFPIREGILMVHEFMPGAKVIGSLYDPGEAFSKGQLAAAEAACKELGLTWVVVPVTQTGEVQSGVRSLQAKGVQAILQLPSNTTNAGIAGQVQECLKAKIPVFSLQVDQLEAGVVAAIGVDLAQSGFEAGVKAAKILKGASPDDFAISQAVLEPPTVNAEAAAKFGVTVPEAFRKSSKS